MKEKKTVLLRVAYLVNFDESEIYSDDDGALDKLSNRLCRNRTLKIDGKRFKVQWASTSEIVLDSSELNCGRCSKCKTWVTDLEKENQIEGLDRGATVDGKLYCDLCFPKEHPLAF